MEFSQGYFRHKIGRETEARALEWYSARFRIRLLARNYRCKGGELDLILEQTLEDGSLELVFVEVRARTQGGWVDGVESVTWEKRRRLERAMKHFLAQYQGRAQTLRTDILGWDGLRWEHYQDVWV